MSEIIDTPESSQVESLLFFHFEGEEEGEVIVFFRSGKVYAYTLTDEEWEAFKEAPSKGSFVQTLQVYTRLK